MKAYERYCAVFDDNSRKLLDRVPSFVQYVRNDFIQQHRNELKTDFEGKQKISKFWPPILWSTRMSSPIELGFDSYFAVSIPSAIIKPIRIKTETGKKIFINASGQSKSVSGYYNEGHIQSLDILERLQDNLIIREGIRGNMFLYKQYQRISDICYPILQVPGVFDRVWQAMGMKKFSYHFRKKTKLYTELIKFYAVIMKHNVKGMINTIQFLGKECKLKVINILDDLAFKDRPMISPQRLREDFFPCYKEVTTMIKDAGLIPQMHSDGDMTTLIPMLQEAGFLGLQGWEGLADPYVVNEQFPDFVVIGFGDISDILPFGSTDNVEKHVKNLMDALKENRHFIIGPSSVLYKGIPLKNVTTFIQAVHKYGKYN